LPWPAGVPRRPQWALEFGAVVVAHLAAAAASYDYVGEMQRG
jgi:hypothetical protein